MANFKGFDYSEYNHKNVIIGTAAFNQSSKWRMNYFEDKVRTGLDEGMTIRYQVTPIYKNGDLIARRLKQSKVVQYTTTFSFTMFSQELQSIIKLVK